MMDVVMILGRAVKLQPSMLERGWMAWAAAREGGVILRRSRKTKAEAIAAITEAIKEDAP